MADPEFLKDRLSWIFRRRGGSGQMTRLFDELEDTQKDALVKAVELGAEELPVLASLVGKDRWLVLTTQRIVWCLDGEDHQLQLSDIADAFVDFHAMVRDGVRKSDVRELEIVTRVGDRHTIGVESGGPLFGVWNVLKNVARRGTGR